MREPRERGAVSGVDCVMEGMLTASKAGLFTQMLETNMAEVSLEERPMQHTTVSKGGTWHGLVYRCNAHRVFVYC